MEIFPLISFFTGVISILSPCILPVIPIFVAFSLKTKSKSEIVSFTLGLLSVFLVIVLLTGFFTSIVYSYIFYIRIFSAVLLLAIGILMLVDYSFSFSVKLPKESDINFMGSMLQRISDFSHNPSGVFQRLAVRRFQYTFILSGLWIDAIRFKPSDFKNKS